ncbi:hypothetical protein I3843_13G122500 [Carya illinoinensis]|nr:hypothetical protein I3843_13G122500 [Carya illinoinensis]
MRKVLCMVAWLRMLPSLRQIFSSRGALMGILDHNFENVQNLQGEENPHFVLDIIDIFCRDAEICIEDMTKSVDEPVVDYAKVTGFIHLLKGSSSSVGGCRIVLACRELRKATESKTKERCVEAVNNIKREFFTVRDNLNAIAKMERSIRTDDAMTGIF